jgi:hypothetical protein
MPTSFNTGIDAAETNSAGQIYFFKGDRYVRFKPVPTGMEPNYPIVTSGNFKNMPASFNSGIDAATTSKGGKIYFFRGDLYIGFSDLSVGMDSQYPVRTSGNWRGMPSSFNASVDAALTDDSGRFYLFKHDQYVRFTVLTGSVDTDYPQSIASKWTGMPESFDAGIDAALMTNAGDVYFFKGDEYVRFSRGQSTMNPGYPKKIRS